jgi:dihydrofolate synthase/folylpolyglutamate synthase
MSYLGNPQDKLRIIHIAGTSGKTSTAYYVSELLSAAGYKTGLTVGPVVDEVNERLQVNGLPVEEVEFCRALTNFSKLISLSPVIPSWFELLIAFAYWYFAHLEVDYAVIEVGLGGLKDGTNVITRPDKVCVITDIGYDHVNVLGDSLTEITKQKSGIILPYNAVFSYNQGPEVMSVLEDIVTGQNAKLFIAQVTENPDKSMPDYQFRNWSLAYKVYEYLVNRDGLNKLSKHELQFTRQIVIPGRMDIRYLNGKTVIMDGAHNVQKIEALVSSFKKLYPGVKPSVLIAMKGGKDLENVAQALAPLASNVITTTFTSGQDLPINSTSAENLANAFKDKVPTISISDQSDALSELMNDPSSVLLITGSIYLLGQIRKNALSALYKEPLLKN